MSADKFEWSYGKNQWTKQALRKFRPIPNAEGYRINGFAQIKSDRRRGFREGTIDKDGYIVVCICVNGVHKKKRLHRLVAEVFIPNPENKPQVNHVDFNKKNNVVTNLSWVTSKEDAEHKVAAGRQAKGDSFNKTGRGCGKLVLNYDTGIFYDTAAEAARAIGIPAKRLHKRLYSNGKSNIAYV